MELKLSNIKSKIISIDIITAGSVFVAALSYYLAARAKKTVKKKKIRSLTKKEEITLKLKPLFKEPLSTIWKGYFTSGFYGFNILLLLDMIPYPYQKMLSALLLSSTVYYMGFQSPLGKNKEEEDEDE